MLGPLNGGACKDDRGLPFRRRNAQLLTSNQTLKTGEHVSRWRQGAAILARSPQDALPLAAAPSEERITSENIARDGPVEAQPKKLAKRDCGVVPSSLSNTCMCHAMYRPCGPQSKGPQVRFPWS